MTATSSPLVQFVGSVMAVAVISRVLTQLKVGATSEMNQQLIRGFLTFFAVSLCYFPISLMLGGIKTRNRFFGRA